MNLAKLTDNQLFIGAVSVMAVGMLAIYASRKAIEASSEAVADGLNAVNPVNHDNIFAAAVNAIGDAIDDSQDNDSFSLGSWIYAITHKSDLEQITGTQAPNSARFTGQVD